MSMSGTPQAIAARLRQRHGLLVQKWYHHRAVWSVAFHLITFLSWSAQCEGQQQQQQHNTITYKPAQGHYVCPQKGQICIIQKCKMKGGLCDQFIYNFEYVSLASRSAPLERDVANNNDNKEDIVYISTGSSASISLGTGDADAIICDAECSCQYLISQDDGSCQQQPTEAPSTISSSPSTLTSPTTSILPSISISPITSISPTISLSPSVSPSVDPSRNPSQLPSKAPSLLPSITPSQSPSLAPTAYPSFSLNPSLSPSQTPSSVPSISPSSRPSKSPSRAPTLAPSFSPTSSPSVLPSISPSLSPTLSPTIDSAIIPLIHRVSGDAIFDPTTPQCCATRWMIQKDKHIKKYDPLKDVVRLTQRYALIALDYAFHFENNRDDSLLNWTNPNTDECTWDGVTCATFDGIPRIRTINWSRRNLTGKPLADAFEFLPALSHLDLAQNNLEGSLEPFFQLTYLNNLYLFENRFTGTLDGIDSLSSLHRLYLGKNQLSGTLSSGLWQENKDRRLQWLILHHNNLSGSLPMGMRLGHLRYLDLSHNSFSSTIPTDWHEKLISLRSLYLDHNQLNGTIPENFASIGNGWLKQLYLNDNMLTGKFPQGWNPKFTLTNIDIRNNQFTRDIPSSVCDMSVFEDAEMIELRADCDICHCWKLCDNCRRNVEIQKL